MALLIDKQQIPAEQQLISNSTENQARYLQLTVTMRGNEAGKINSEKCPRITNLYQTCASTIVH